jgi:hypothetical protein
VRKAIELAKAGDTQMLKFLLDRIFPRERSVCIDLPAMEHADDAVDALGKIINAVGSGHIAPNEGAHMATLVMTYARAINAHELEFRLDKIENDLGALKNGNGS